MSFFNKLRYLVWAGVHSIGVDTACPACNEAKTLLLKRKYGVTALYRCPACEVMFRVPKPSAEAQEKFYQSDYEQGFTTDCPAPDELEKLKHDCFSGTEKDYSTYIEVLLASGLDSGSSVFDFGCSWGYGSWQLSHAGYRVYSFELSRPRARYAAQNLGCELYPPDELPEKVDCFFSAHVIEHLTNPRTMWETARDVLRPRGKMVAFLPNGDPSLELVNRNYHQLWNQVHPLLLSALALTRMGELFGFEERCYTKPYDYAEIAQQSGGKLSGDELLVVGTLPG